MIAIITTLNMLIARHVNVPVKNWRLFFPDTASNDVILSCDDPFLVKIGRFAFGLRTTNFVLKIFVVLNVTNHRLS
jgi:hypothetical protein